MPNKMDRELLTLLKGITDCDLRSKCELSWVNAKLNVKMFGGSEKDAIKEATRRVKGILGVHTKRIEHKTQVGPTDDK